MDRVSQVQNMVTQTQFLSLELQESPHGAYLWTDPFVLEPFFLLYVDIWFKRWNLIFPVDGIRLLTSPYIMLCMFGIQFLLIP